MSVALEGRRMVDLGRKSRSIELYSLPRYSSGSTPSYWKVGGHHKRAGIGERIRVKSDKSVSTNDFSGGKKAYHLPSWPGFIVRRRLRN